jgi:sentrin-specific protease 1
LAAINAIKSSFENAEVKGCHFHFSQAIKKHIKTSGFETEYMQNKAFKVWLKTFLVFPLIPVDQISYIWNRQLQFKPTTTTNINLDIFLQYFYKQWLDNSSLPVSHWNHHDNFGPRTNNHVEAFNLKLGNFIDYDHPHVYSLVKTFQELEFTCILNYLQRKNGGKSQRCRHPVDVKRDARIRELKFSLASGHISIIDYALTIQALFSLKEEEKGEKLDEKDDQQEKKTTEKYPKFDLSEHLNVIQEAFVRFQTKQLNGITIAIDDIRRLGPRTWLNDVVVDYYLNLITTEDKSVYCFTSYFYTSVLKHGINGVLNWFRNVQIFHFKKIFIPIVQNSHWMLIVVDLEVYKIILYDSFAGIHDDILKSINFFFVHKYKMLYPAHSLNFTLSHAQNLPRQHNSFDCGVYLLKFAQFILQNRFFNFTDDDMPRYRQKIVLSILQNKIL